MGAFLRTAIAAIIAGTALCATQAPAGEQKATLETEKGKVSYAIGVNVMGNLKKQGIDFDLDLVMQGMKDAHAGGQLGLEDGELRRAMKQYYTAVRQNQSKAWSRAAEDNKEAGMLFFAENGKKEGVVSLPVGLQYKVVKTGSGNKPSDADTVEVRYRGTLINGTEFDSSDGKPETFKMSAVIPGWREALKLMPAGSTWQLFIPPQLAYGERGKQGSVGPNTTVIYEIELIGVK